MANLTEIKRLSEELYEHLRPRWWSKMYYRIKDFLFPWNVIKLKKLPRSWCDVDGRMEHAIMQLLVDFFHGEQPFHLSSGTPYEKNVSYARHRELLPLAHDDPEIIAVWNTLLDIAEWYETDGYRVDGVDVYIAASSIGTPHEECSRLKREYDAQVDEKYLFVVKHRAWLWT